MLHTRRRHTALALGALMPLALTACGSGGDAMAASAKAAIKASILKSEKSGGDATSPLKLDDTQAGCFAGQLVDHLGVAQLKKDGVLNEDGKVAQAISAGNLKLPAADAGTFVSALFDCTNGGGQVVTLFHTELGKKMANLPAAAKTCIDTKLDAAFVRKILIATLSGQGEAPVTAQITQVTRACMTAPS